MDFCTIQSLFSSNDGHNLKEIMHNHVNFTNLNRNDIGALNRWLKEHSCKYKNEHVIMYHGTSAEHDIVNQGLQKTRAKTKKSLQSQIGYVCLSLYPESARTFGELAYPSKEISVYAVKVPLRELAIDSDQLHNKRMWGDYKDGEIKRTLADSLVYGSGARIKRDIQPYEVRLIPNM